jgi:hypothetical protein
VTGPHLDPAAILASNAKVLAEAAAHPATFLGPQMTPHRKPNAGGGPCDVCGCPGLRLGVRHYALPALHGTRAAYVKTSRDYSGEWAETYLTWEGRGA